MVPRERDDRIETIDSWVNLIVTDGGADLRFEGSQVYIRRDEVTGDVILSRRPESWQDFFTLAKTTAVRKDFLSDRKEAPPQERNLS